MPRTAVNLEMAALIGRLVPTDGQVHTSVPGLKLIRSSLSMPRTPVHAEPCVVIVCQGRKVSYLGDKSYIYDAENFLLLAVPLPFEGESFATPQEPLLAMCVAIDLAVVAEFAHQMALPAIEPLEAAEGIASAPLDAPLADSALRLLRVLECPVQTRVLGPALMREVSFRVLAGPRGDALRSALVRRGAFGQIACALRRIHTDFHANLDVATLAREVNLSAAAFHAQFKRVTSTSPMQYLKATRLHKARLLMIQDGVNASRAADRVGYESPSQFSREFKRLFGRTPIDEIRAVQATYGGDRGPRDRP